MATKLATDLDSHNNFFWRSPSNLKVNKVFDYDSTCVNSGTNEKPDSCCGSDIAGIPYNSKTKSCCAGYGAPKLFNPSVHECCEGEVTNIGSC